MVISASETRRFPTNERSLLMETPNDYTAQSGSSSGRKRLAGIVGAGLVAGLMAVGIGGVALAQDQPVEVEPTIEATEADVETPVDPQAEADPEAVEVDDPILEELSPEAQQGSDDVEIEDMETGEALELSDGDIAVLDRFEDCLADNGVDGITEESVADSEIDAYMDSAFDTCDPILDELSAELQDELGDDIIFVSDFHLEGCGE